MFKNSIKVFTAAAAAAALVACGGGSDGPVKKAATNTAYTISKNAVNDINALPPVKIAYTQKGLKQIEHKGNGKATFTDTANKTVEGKATVGSCVFAPNEAIGSLAAKEEVKFTPCLVSLATKNVVAGSSKKVDAKVQLGTNAPVDTKVTVAVTEKGKVAVGGVNVGSVGFITGGGS